MCICRATATSSLPTAQIFVAVGNTSDSVTITWITSTAGTGTSVEYGTSASFGSTATGTTGSYKIGSYTSGEIKTVYVAGLAAATVYYYRVGGASGWSPTSTFTSNSVGAAYPYHLAVMGDPGQTTNSNSTFTHVAGSKARSYLVTGDLSYADGDQVRSGSAGRRRARGRDGATDPVAAPASGPLRPGHSLSHHVTHRRSRAGTRSSACCSRSRRR